MAVADPTLDLEARLHSDGHRFVIGCDEVGRGALAGPVAVGFALVDTAVDPIPAGLRDSKMLSEKRREELAPLAHAWARYCSVGMATAREVDEIGLSAALGLAGRRGLLELHAAGADISSSIVLLDGAFDWLNPALRAPVLVELCVKADRDCASVAAASVIAKVARDRLMIEADARHPGYEWAGNKGYGSARHLDAIARLGATDLHRRSWLKSAAPTTAPTTVALAS
ncbi:ribonuclease HII [Marisediminicola sp. LYQ134]|uniref:ribonuclease HII n=1 Tax=unclassified Marisediminicola TaxID=2618316 RepID=UPI0039833575